MLGILWLKLADNGSFNVMGSLETNRWAEGPPGFQPADAVNICLVNPAHFPEWFWLPAAHRIEEMAEDAGAKVNVIVPNLPRSEPGASIKDEAETIYATTENLDNLYITSFSRGVYATILFLLKLRQQNQLKRILGWTSMNSVGPPAYESAYLLARKPLTFRHNPEHVAAISKDASGMERIDPAAAEKYLVHDISDQSLRHYTATHLISQRPYTEEEKAYMPYWQRDILPVKWIIGRGDIVDNLDLSAEVAKRIFGVNPTYKNWGHAAPLSHIDEVSKEILDDAYKASRRKTKIRRLSNDISAEKGHDQPDSLMYVASRRIINEQFAEHPVDFNIEGLRAAQALAGLRPIRRDDLFADIGSTNGIFIAQAAEATGFKAHIIGVEPDPENVAYYSLLADRYKKRVSLIEAYGENISLLPTNSVRGASAHNVIFRAYNVLDMLRELKRIVEPGGVIAVSTNAVGHAGERHRFERRVAKVMAEITGVNFSFPEPAFGYYLEDLPAIIEESGDLEIIDLEDRGITQRQDTRAIITRARLESFISAIQLSCTRAPFTAEQRKMWRQVTKRIVGDEINLRLIEQEQQGAKQEPFFADTIKRGMVVMLNLS